MAELTPRDDKKLHDLIDSAFDDETPSITEVNGSVARFGMSYAPPGSDRHVFHAPFRQIAPSLVYALAATFVFTLVFALHATAGAGPLHKFIVEDDAVRALGSRPFAWLLVASAGATLIRAWLRGVVVSPEGIEVRELGTLGFPRVVRWNWVQVDRLIIDPARGRVLVELWNGQKAFLPAVRHGREMRDTLLGLATQHKKDVTVLAS